MRWISEKPWLAAGILAVTFAAAGGLGLGVATTGDEGDAEAAQAVEYETAFEQSFDQVWSIARQRGLETGKIRGRLAGERAGSLEGFDLAGGVAGLQIIEDQLASAEAERAAAEAELTERQANCGSIAREPDICPTNEELAGYQAALKAAKKAKKEAEKEADQNDADKGSGRGDG